MIADAVEKMIDYYQGNQHDIAHFLKVWAYARTMGTLEHLDEHTQQVLELAAVVHDISCPLCREKYGSCEGKLQERESPELIASFFQGFPISSADLKRISWLVSHHHSNLDLPDPDYRILLEADFLVNAGEQQMSGDTIEDAGRNLFRTPSGIRLLNSVYGGKRE